MSENNQEQRKASKGLSDKEVAKTELPNPEVFIPEDVKPILEKLEEKEQKTIVSAMIALTVKSSWTGPIPPPDILGGYNDVVPNGAERILRMAEKQSDHRMEIEKTVINRELNQSGRGQNYAVFIVVLVLIVSFILIYLGHDIAGGILGGIDLVALASVFVIGKFGQKRELAKKK